MFVFNVPFAEVAGSSVHIAEGFDDDDDDDDDDDVIHHRPTLSV